MSRLHARQRGRRCKPVCCGSRTSSGGRGHTAESSPTHAACPCPAHALKAHRQSIPAGAKPAPPRPHNPSSRQVPKRAQPQPAQKNPRQARPTATCGRPQVHEYLGQHISIALPREPGPPQHELRKDTAAGREAGGWAGVRRQGSAAGLLDHAASAAQAAQATPDWPCCPVAQRPCLPPTPLPKRGSPCRPDVHSRAIAGAAIEELGGPVPPRKHLRPQEG